MKGSNISLQRDIIIYKNTSPKGLVEDKILVFDMMESALYKPKSKSHSTNKKFQ